MAFRDSYNGFTLITSELLSVGNPSRFCVFMGVLGNVHVSLLTSLNKFPYYLDNFSLRSFLELLDVILTMLIAGLEHSVPFMKGLLGLEYAAWYVSVAFYLGAEDFLPVFGLSK